MLKKQQDAFGHEIYDYFTKKRGYEIVERDDGYFDLSTGPRPYFNEYPEWQLHEKQAMKYVQGRVLDIGCGAGRHSLYLQKRGFDVLGIDNSPKAVRVCRMRGLRKTRLLSVTGITARLGKFDTIIMFGNNFGLFGSFERARWLLKRFYNSTSEQGRIIAESRDPYNTNLPEHLRYHQRNRNKGRMSGQIRIRVRYQHYATPWFDYLMVSQTEINKILRGTGWMVKKFLTSRSAMYIAFIEKERAGNRSV